MKKSPLSMSEVSLSAVAWLSLLRGSPIAFDCLGFHLVSSLVSSQKPCPCLWFRRQGFGIDSKASLNVGKLPAKHQRTGRRAPSRGETRGESKRGTRRVVSVSACPGLAWHLAHWHTVHLSKFARARSPSNSFGHRAISPSMVRRVRSPKRAAYTSNPLAMAMLMRWATLHRWQ